MSFKLGKGVIVIGHRVNENMDAEFVGTRTMNCWRLWDHRSTIDELLPPNAMPSDTNAHACTLCLVITRFVIARAPMLSSPTAPVLFEEPPNTILCVEVVWDGLFRSISFSLYNFLTVSDNQQCII